MMKSNQASNDKEESLKSLKVKAIIGVVTCSIVMGGVGFAIGARFNFNSNESTYSDEFKSFLKYYEYFKNNYYLEQDERTLIDGLYYGLTSSVNDDYTFYVSKENDESQGLTTTSVGLGYYRSVYYGNELITQVMPNSPAESAYFIDEDGNKLEDEPLGLKEGDLVTKVREVDKVNDYYVLSEHPSKEWSSHISGEANTKVELVIIRDGVEKRCIVKRNTFDSAKTKLVDMNYTSSCKEATIRINSFLGNYASNETTPAREIIDLFRNKLLKDNDSIDNLILDLRGNGGGYVINCSELLSLFVGKKDSYGYYYYPRSNQYERIGNNSSIYNYSGWENYNSKIKHYTIILDENSASATESFALNMRDYDETKDKVTIVGEISYGKGIAQSFIYPFKDDSVSSVRYTSAQVVSNKLNSINKRGIVPDVMVDSNYRSIQDAEAYDYYRKEVTSVSSIEDKGIVMARISSLLGKEYTSLTEALNDYQYTKGLTRTGEYDEATIKSLNDNFYDYYQKNKPTNIYSSFVSGNDDIDSFSSAQRKFVKKQIELVTGNSYTNFYSACKDFQTIYSSSLGDEESVFSLKTSYLLQGKIYDLREELKNQVLDFARDSYGA